MNGYISYLEARSTQCDALESVIQRMRTEVRRQQAAGGLVGPGPVFLGIGASLAAAAAPVWSLRERGIDGWRLGAGDTPLPLPASDHQIIAISQSGRSSETIAALESVDRSLRYAVINTAPSPLSELADSRLELGNIPDSYASTIGYTSTIVGLAMIAEAWNGGAIDESWTDFATVLRAVDSSLDTAAALFDRTSSADFVGAGASVGSAEAGALLFREVARVSSSAMGTREYLHGAMESAGGGVTVLLGDRRELKVATTLAGAGHRVLFITDAVVPQTPGVTTIRIPEVSPSQRAIVEILVLQRLVADVADRHGINIEEFVFHHDDTKVESA